MNDFAKWIEFMQTLNADYFDQKFEIERDGETYEMFIHLERKVPKDE
jgi:hypothetical protein